MNYKFSPYRNDTVRSVRLSLKSLWSFSELGLKDEIKELSIIAISFSYKNQREFKNIFLIFRQYVSCKKGEKHSYIVTRKATIRKNEIRGSLKRHYLKWGLLVNCLNRWKTKHENKWNSRSCPFSEINEYQC